MSPAERFDAVVVGGGLMGLATVDALLRRGRRVALVERFAPGHRQGSSHGDGRIFRFTYPEAVYVALARRAEAGWRSLERRAGTELLDLVGNWDCGPEGSPELADLEANLAGAGLPFEHLSAAQSNARFPQLRLEAGSVALHQPDGGVAFADRALGALWRLAREAGAELVTEDPIEGLDAGSGGVTMATSGGRRITGEVAVLTAGSWSRPLLAALGLRLPLQVTREQVAYFPSRNGVDHRRLPTVIDYHTPLAFYALPQIETPGVKVGWHHAGLPIEHPEQGTDLDAANLAAVQDFVRRRLPHLEPEPFEVATCLYTTTPDQHFILDRHPGEPRLVIGAGFSGHGFKFGPAVGEILTALALGEPAPLDLGTFRVGRFAAG
ncbi:MAG TPA: N-methyl-L-tryptophan oxidase [Thermoanaerobaculia bacterium]|nr:N-methyl-L-tryptophan oxidase [Thermoanaerobaculia bacterium]